MRLILIFLVLSTLESKGQEIQGYWYNAADHSFMELKSDSCILTNSYVPSGSAIKHVTKKKDMVGRFISFDVHAKIDSTSLTLWHYYYSSGLIFWRQKEKVKYKIETLTDSTLVLIGKRRYLKKNYTIVDLMGNSKLIYKRMTKENFLYETKN